MFLVGLTGGIASGKSTVAERFVHYGAELIDADEVAGELVLPGTEGWKGVVEHFGYGVLDEDGFVDRAALARIVFNDPGKRAVLNGITHPLIIAAIADRLEVLSLFDGVVVIDAPLLVEAGLDHGFDAVVVVASHPETQLHRLTALRGASEEEARERIAAQAPLEDKLAVATHVVWNEGSLAEVRAEADRLAAELHSLSEQKAAAEGEGVPDD